MVAGSFFALRHLLCIHVYFGDVDQQMKKHAILVDIDGTVALQNGRGPFDYHLVRTDLPNLPVIEVVQLMHNKGYAVVFLSGRPDSCREDTERWLSRQVRVTHSGLFMRSDEDYRKDYIVKAELYEDYVEPFFEIHSIFDDRKQVVEMWRKKGFTVFQVAEGNF